MPATLNEMRQIDEYLSGFAQAEAASQDAAIAREIFPEVDTGGKEGGRYTVYPKANHMKRTDSVNGLLRANKSDPNWGTHTVSSATFDIHEYSRAELVNGRDRSNAQGTYSPEEEVVYLNTRQILLEREIRAYSLMDNLTPNRTLAATQVWDGTQASPFSDIETGVRTVALATGGRSGLIVVMGGAVYSQAVKGAVDTSGSAGSSITERLKYTHRGDDQDITPSLLARMWSVDDVVVGNWVYDTAGIGLSASNAWVWASDKVWIVRRNAMSDGPTSRIPTFGKTFVAIPLQTRTWPEPSLDGSEAFETFEACQEVVTGASHVYTLANVLG
jgi:hypothetical protein